MTLYLKLIWMFAKIDIFGFGGGLAMLPLIYREADKLNVMTEKQFEQFLVIVQASPGALAINAATYVGYTGASFAGAAVAIMGVAIPSLVIMITVSKLMMVYCNSTVVESSFMGIRPVTIGLIASAVVLIGKDFVIDMQIVPLLICGASAFLSIAFKVNPVLLFVAGGVIGAFLCG